MVNVTVVALFVSSFLSASAVAKRHHQKHYNAGDAGWRGGSSVCRIHLPHEPAPVTPEPVKPEPVKPAAVKPVPVASVAAAQSAVKVNVGAANSVVAKAGPSKAVLAPIDAKPSVVAPLIAAPSVPGKAALAPSKAAAAPSKADAAPGKAIAAAPSKAADVPAKPSVAPVPSVVAAVKPSAAPSAVAKAAALPVSVAIPSVAAPLPSVTVPRVDFVANTVGGGGGEFLDSAHFRVWAGPKSPREASLKLLETAYSCFVEDFGWRSSGLSINKPVDNPGPYSKLNVYSKDTLGGSAGQQGSDGGAGFAFLNVVDTWLASPPVIVHEYGHALTYHERNWLYQKRTGAWWETVAQFFADTVVTSPLCAGARTRNNQPESGSLMDLGKVIGDAHQVIVDGTPGSGNYYQAWPFLVYLTNNPDNFPNLGKNTVREMFRQYKINSDETPLHVLERILGGQTKVSQVVARYWARMAFVDIGHAQGATRFKDGRKGFNYANLDGANGQYTAKADRAPRYMGASIVPLKVAAAGGAVTAKVTAPGAFIATLVVKDAAGKIKYIDFADGAASATLGAGDEATVVIANTPDQLILYDGFALVGTDANKGLVYQLQLTGATA